MIAYKGVTKDLKSGFDGFQYEVGKTYSKPFNLSINQRDGFYFGDISCAKSWAERYQGVVLEVDVSGILWDRAKTITINKII